MQVMKNCRNRNCEGTNFLLKQSVRMKGVQPHMLFELIKGHLLLSIYILINLIVIFLYGIDKWKAIHHKWRIPEAHLILAGVFGIFGAVLGMLLFRHKIRKPKFYIGLPAIFILELMCVILYIKCL